jgi:uncharacterized phage infection (PIP) family protein YhgE
MAEEKMHLNRGETEMEDSNQTPNAAGAQSSSQGDAQPSGATQQPGQELLDELTQLADKFAGVVKSAWNSEQRKQVESDVRSGLSTMAASLEDGFRQVASSNEAKDLQTKASEVGEKVTSTKFFADLTGALTTGLRTLSDQLDKVASDLQTKNAQSGATPPSATETDASDTKDIPINKE